MSVRTVSKDRWQAGWRRSFQQLHAPDTDWNSALEGLACAEVMSSANGTYSVRLYGTRKVYLFEKRRILFYWFKRMLHNLSVSPMLLPFPLGFTIFLCIA